MISKLQGVILAGGESRRFGSPKAFVKKEGLPFYYYSILAIEPFVASILLVTNPKLEHLFKQESENITLVTDHEQYAGQGPLAGIYTAMETVEASWYVVIPIDVPFMEPQVIRELIKYIDLDVDVIVPTISGKVEPLISIYNYSMKEAIKNQLDKGKRAVYQLLKTSEVKYVPMDNEKLFVNINDRVEFQKWIKNDN